MNTEINSNLSKIHVGVIADTSSSTGHVLLGEYNGMVPVAAVPIACTEYCGAVIVHTGNYYAHLVSWYDASVSVVNRAVTLVVFYARV